jgi:hypothetical protein
MGIDIALNDSGSLIASTTRHVYKLTTPMMRFIKRRAEISQFWFKISSLRKASNTDIRDSNEQTSCRFMSGRL